MNPTGFVLLQQHLDRLLELAQNGQWSDAATLMQQIQQQRLFSASPADRPAIEACLKKLGELAEIAEPLHGQMGKLLKGLAATS